MQVRGADQSLPYLTHHAVTKEINVSISKMPQHIQGAGNTSGMRIGSGIRIRIARLCQIPVLQYRWPAAVGMIIACALNGLYGTSTFLPYRSA
jgi:hypothetical protein